MSNQQSIVHACAAASQSSCEGLLGEFHGAIVSKLDDLLDNSRSNLQQWQLMELQRKVKSTREIFEANFLKELNNSYQGFQQGDYHINDVFKDPSTTGSSLSLVTNDSLEHNIAASALIQRVNGEFTEPLCLLHERLCAAIGKTLPEDANPVGPIQIAQYFEAALKPLELESQISILFFKLFEKTLLACMGELYGTLNKTLVEANVLPSISFTELQRRKLAKQSGQASTPSPPSSMEPEPVSEQALNQTLEQETVARAQQFNANPIGQQVGQAPQAPIHPDTALPNAAYQQHLFSAIQQMQQSAVNDSSNSSAMRALSDKDIQPRPSSQPNNAPRYSRSEVVTALNQLQGSAAPVNGSAQQMTGAAATALIQPIAHFETLEPGKLQACPVQPLATVVQALEESLPEGEQALGNEEVGTIDIVGMIFEFMLKDEQLPDSVKSLLSYLHVPYIKVALHDPELFGQSDHPARVLLNKLSEAGTLWLNKEGYGQFKVFNEIKSVVDKILKDFGEGAQLFEDLLNSFTEFVEKVEHRVEQLERLSAQKAEAEQRLQKVKAYVHKRIKARVHKKSVPSPVVALLLYPWFDYLTSIMLRFGEKSEQWQQGLQFIDNLLWSIQPKQSAHEVSRLHNLQSLLEKQLQHCFDTIGYEQTKGDDLMDKIKVLQDNAIQTEAAEITVSKEDQKEIKQMEAQTVDREKTIEAPDLATLTNDEKEIVGKLKLIEFGTWFEFIEDEPKEDDPQKLKVAWFNRENLSFLFVNSAGKQVLMLTALEIARSMISKSARIIAGSAKPFFERALESIYHRMADQAVQAT